VRACREEGGRGATSGEKGNLAEGRSSHHAKFHKQAPRRFGIKTSERKKSKRRKKDE